MLHSCAATYALCLFSIGALAQNRIYVNSSATGANNGQSWADAFNDLQVALAAAQAGDSVWVAQGTYFPTNGAVRAVSFEPRSGVRLFGGFAGNEDDPSQRDWDAHPTVLSGDIGVPGDSTDNSYNVMAFSEAEEGTLLDGLTFRGGTAEPEFVFESFQRDGCGGGLYVNAGDGVAYVVVRNCRFERNYARLKGAGAFIRAAQDGSIAPQFLNCSFEGNGGFDGSAVYCDGFVDIERIPDFGHCTFTDNKVFAVDLAVIFYRGPATNDTLHFWDCRFEKHKSPGSRLIWTSTNNHLRFDDCDFREGPSILWSFPLDHQSCYATRCSIINNGPAGFSALSEVRVKDCVFKNNFRGFSTNAPLTEVSNCLLDSCRFGLVAISFGSTCQDCRVSNLTISNNKSRIQQGSSLFSLGEAYGIIKYHNIQVINNDSLNIFYSNQYADSTVFTNFSFIGNRFYQRPNAATVPARFQNTLFYNNEYLSQDYFSLFPSITLENSAIDFPDCSYLPPSVTCINNLFNLDPLFRDPANGDYSLLPCSPLINAGSNLAAAGILTDIAGNPRIQSGTVDIGAYESPAFALSGTSQVQPACLGASNGSISLQPENGCAPLVYQWSPNVGSGPELDSLAPGLYVLTLTDGSGQQITNQFVVETAPSPALALVPTDVLCGTQAGGTLSASVQGGTAPFEYLWSPAAADTLLLTQQQPGTYALTIVDATGCQDSATASIALMGQITLAIGGQIIPCHGETGWLSATPATGAAPFSWHWDGWPGTDPVAEPLGPGQYSVTVTDAYGCTAANTYPPMTEPGPLSVGTGSSDQTQSNPPNGAAVVTTISGGTGPFGYFWEPGGGTTQAIAGLVAGTYTVTVTDKNGCSISTEVVVEQMISSTDHIPEGGVIIYPNPATDWLRVLLPATLSGASWHLELSDTSGRVVRSQGCETGDCVLDLSGLASGAFVLTARSVERVVVGKVIRR
jgi:hypothetical protein